jgi:hypothetical protein
MNKYQAIYKWFNDLGIPFYVDTNVPDMKEISYPYGTYQNVIGSWPDRVSNTVRLYYRTTSEKEINAMVQKLTDKLKENNQVICDDGMLWVNPGAPYCQAVSDEEDDTIRSRYINLLVDYFTN